MLTYRFDLALLRFSSHKPGCCDGKTANVIYFLPATVAVLDRYLGNVFIYSTDFKKRLALGSYDLQAQCNLLWYLAASQH